MICKKVLRGKGVLAVRVRGRKGALEEDGEEDKRQRHGDDTERFAVPLEVQEEEDEDDGREGKAIRAVGVVPYLEADKVELDPNARGNEYDEQRVPFQYAQENKARHVGNTDVLEVYPEDVALQIRAGAPADAVVYLKADGKTGEEDVDDVPAVPCPA